MTPIQIAYFKHFLFDKGIQKLYISMYKTNRLRGSGNAKQDNPESLELFLQEKPYTDVVIKAFYFQVNSFYGYDYWLDIQEKWNQYWKMHENNFSNDKYITLKGTFSILRQNWDNIKYFELESKKETYVRMKIEPPLKDENVETAFDIVPHQERHVNPNDTQVSQSAAQESDEDVLGGFSLMNVKKIVGGRKIEENFVSVNRKQGFRITFSVAQSDLLIDGGYKYVKYLTNKETKEVALVFNYTDGISVSIKKHSYYNSSNKNIVINSKAIVDHLTKFYGIKEEYSLLSITATIKQKDCIIFKIKKVDD